MKFGVNLLLWTASVQKQHLPLFPKIRSWGFDGVEVPLFAPKPGNLTEIRHALEANQLESTVVSIIPKTLHLGSESASVRLKTVQFMREILEDTKKLGAEVVAGPLYSPVGYLPGRRRTPEEWDWAVDSYREIAKVAEDLGILVAIEPLNRFETYFFNTVQDSVKFAKAVNSPKIKILVDTFHANIEEKDVAQAYLQCGSYLGHVHTCENDRGTPGSGHVPWLEVLQALRKLNYSGWLTIESFGFAMKEIAAAACIWRDLASSVDAIAEDGLKFLKTEASKVWPQP